MVSRQSALEGHYKRGRFGHVEGNGVTLQEVRDLSLIQVAAWPESYGDVAAKLADCLGLSAAPGPGEVVTGSKGALMRTEPLKWWVCGGSLADVAAAIPIDMGTCLDLSHSRTHLRITGPKAAVLLNHFLPLDLREESFPVGRLAATAFHHTGAALWRSEEGYELFLLRTFALSLWEILVDSALQYGVTVE